MALFGNKKKDAKLGFPADPKWVHGEGGRFPKFLELDPEAAGLTGVSAVFAIWHTGAKPGWVYVGSSSDLAATFLELAENPDVLQFRDRGSMHCSWCLIREEFQRSVVGFLTRATKPEVENPDAPPEGTVELIPVYPPGMVPDEVKEAAKKEAEEKVTSAASNAAVAGNGGQAETGSNGEEISGDHYAAGPSPGFAPTIEIEAEPSPVATPPDDGTNSPTPSETEDGSGADGAVDDTDANTGA